MTNALGLLATVFILTAVILVIRDSDYGMLFLAAGSGLAVIGNIRALRRMRGRRVPSR